MKKVFTIISLSILIWGCAKKMTPAKSETPSTNTSNTGSNNSNNTGPVSTNNNGNSSNETKTPATNTQSVPVGNTGTTGVKIAAPNANSPENLAIKDGQSTYNVKCGRCHGLKVTTDYTEVRWVQVMQVMAPNAKLTDTEKNNVLAYVRANAKKG